MEVTIKFKAKEIAALVSALQEKRVIEIDAKRIADMVAREQRKSARKFA